MAWMEYFAVRSSTVYENKGLAKALLMTIALMIQRAEEGEEPTENEGWCFASERYLAESLGMSESRVCVWVDKFFDDGWLVVEQKRNAHGHLHNRYRLADNAMSRLEKMKRERGAERPKNLNKVRPDSTKNFLHARSNEEDSTREARVSDAFRGENTPPAPSNEASALGAMKFPRSEQDGVAARSAQRSGGRGFSEKSLQNAERETATSASQRENLGETPNPQKAQRVQTAGSCAPLQPSADRETTGGRPSLPPPKDNPEQCPLCKQPAETVIDGVCKLCYHLGRRLWAKPCEHRELRREWERGVILLWGDHCRKCGEDASKLYDQWGEEEEKKSSAAQEATAQ